MARDREDAPAEGRTLNGRAGTLEPADGIRLRRPSRAERGRRREGAEREREPVPNAVRPVKRRTAEAARDVPVERRPSAADAKPANASAVPQDVLDRFVQVGRHFYFPDGAHAFTDRGRRLVTPSENTEVIRTLIEVAKARGWEQVVVSGTERFRKEAWAAGQLAGVAVRGYRATEFEKEQLVKALVRRRETSERVAADETLAAPPKREARGARAERVIERDGDLITGRLVDHGKAPYLQRRGEPTSYFVTLETLTGQRTVWGNDLERALTKSLTQPQPGDEVGMRIVAREPVTVKRLQRGEDGRSLEMREASAQRNRWVAEKREFFEERAVAAATLRDASVRAQKAVRDRPELTGSYLYLKGAEEVAKKRIRDPEDRRKFVALVRGALADAVERGEPLPPVRLRERATPERRQERDAAPSR